MKKLGMKKLWLIATLCCVAPFIASAQTDFAAREAAADRLRAIELNFATVNDVEIAYRVLGDASNPSVMMIMGLGSSHVLWGDRLPSQIVAAGYRVILFDNRDVGDSQRFEEFGEPLIWWQLLKNKFGFEVDAAYDLGDMANDTVALMDALNIEQAHVIGASMGGMIAQIVAARYPQRTTSLVSIMSTPGFADHLPQPSTEANNQLTDLANSDGESDATARLHHIGLYPEAMPRQVMAIFKSGDRSEEVKTIVVPTLVLHGEDDTLIPPRHGEYTAELIEGSTFITFAGMGHNIPATVLPALAGNMITHMQTQDGRQL
ncbi:alpha/beta hydrolase [Halieaceae bacterium IMCC14734]|uniref:Alpha/beta hydrolase n=1 Tax=Candidatus Litorirhabdus singularis TaxID=2518993 RepID=A0ABT3TFH3_9GAMM|nr:alpha/beta hydrolase [Candidatus Litorirhabdus singularis]MCX2980521.1 alpha/beta hydrolase [Candidatus Litorirhabdus singularis]